MSTNDSDVTFIVRKLEAALARVALLTHRRPLLSLLAVLLVTAGAGQLARRLSIDADMINLLPPSFESIRDLEALKERFGGVGYVVVVGHGRANAVAVQGAIETASRYARTGLVDAMTRRLAGERPR